MRSLPSRDAAANETPWDLSSALRSAPQPAWALQFVLGGAWSLRSVRARSESTSNLLRLILTVTRVLNTTRIAVGVAGADLLNV